MERFAALYDKWYARFLMQSEEKYGTIYGTENLRKKAMKEALIELFGRD